MKLNENTLNVLKNFSTINQSLVFQEGNELSTVSGNKTILAKAKVKDSFPQKFCVYDLNRLLGVISIHDDPELTFTKTHVDIGSGNRVTSYVYTNESLVVKPPEKELVLPSAEVDITLEQGDFEDIMKAANVLSSTEISIVGDGKNISIIAQDVADSSAGKHSITVDETDKTFSFNFKVENMKMMRGTYNVKVSQKGLAQFIGESVEYFIAIENSSTYED